MVTCFLIITGENLMWILAAAAINVKKEGIGI